MKTDEVALNRKLVLAVLGSFVACAGVVILRLGLGATPYSTVDSIGRPMGFNDPLGLEHYFIMIRNFDASELLKLKYAYEWLLLAMHPVGAVLLFACSRVSVRLLRWFFALQVVVFPFGLPAILCLPLVFGGSLVNRMDREGFVDVPFIIMVAHPIWILTSLFIAFALRGEGLGLKRVWKGILQIGRKRGEPVVKAIS